MPGCSKRLEKQLDGEAVPVKEQLGPIGFDCDGHKVIDELLSGAIMPRGTFKDMDIVLLRGFEVCPSDCC